MPVEGWIQHSRVNEFLYDWQTFIAGVFALLAAFGTVVVTMIIANKRVTASRKEADKVIAATGEQTETTVRLERERGLREPYYSETGRPFIDSELMIRMLIHSGARPGSVMWITAPGKEFRYFCRALSSRVKSGASNRVNAFGS